MVIKGAPSSGSVAGVIAVFFSIVFYAMSPNTLSAQHIEVSHESGIWPQETEIMVSLSEADGRRLFYTMDGSKPNEDSPYLEEGQTLMFELLTDSEPVYSKIRTTIDEPDDYNGGNFSVNPGNIIHDSVFQTIESVEKIITLRLRLEGTDWIRVYHYFPQDKVAKYGNSLLTAITFLNPGDYWGPCGIGVEGECDQQLASIIDSAFQGVSMDTFVYVTDSAYIPLSEVSGSIVWSPDSAMLTLTCLNCQDPIDPGPMKVIVDFEGNIITILSATNDTLVAELIGFNDYGEIYMIIWSELDQFQITPYHFLPEEPLSTGPFFALDNSLSDKFPELPKQTLHKRAWMTIIKGRELIYDTLVLVNTAGGSSVFEPKKAMHVKAVGPDNRFGNLFDNGFKEETLYLWKGSQHQRSRIVDPLMNMIMEDQGIGVKQYETTTVFLQGEYWGWYMWRPKDTRRWFSDQKWNGNNYRKSDIVKYRYSGYGHPHLAHPYSQSWRDAVRGADYRPILDFQEFVSMLNTVEDSLLLERLFRRVDLRGFLAEVFANIWSARSDNAGSNGRLYYTKTDSVLYTVSKDYDVALAGDVESNYFEKFHNQEFPFIPTPSNPKSEVIPWQAYLFQEFYAQPPLRTFWWNQIADLMSFEFKYRNTGNRLFDLVEELSVQINPDTYRWQHLMPDMSDSLIWIENDVASIDNFLKNRNNEIWRQLNEFYGLDSLTAHVKLHYVNSCISNGDIGVQIGTIRPIADLDTVVQVYAFVNVPRPYKVLGDNFLFITVNEVDTLWNPEGNFLFRNQAVHEITVYFECLETDPGIGQLRFAETVPDNATVTVDDYGRDGKDYLELHNPTFDTINLRGAYLSDKRHRLDKHRIEEDLFLAPDQRVVFFADEDSERGVYHLNFRLNKEGETVYLSYDGLSVTDSLQWGVTVPTDLSWSVCPAGNGIANATPGYGNDCPELPLSVSDPSQPGQLMVKLCPNPTSGPINITGAENTTAEVLSLSGKVLMSKYLEGYQEAMDLTGLPAGIYMIRFFREGVLQGVGKAVRI